MISVGIDTRRLEHFLAVYEAGGVREAARRIHVAQPALSRTIAELEEELGLPLFVRTGRRMVATDAASRVAEDARRVLLELEALVARARAMAEGSEGRLRIGTSPSATFHSLVPTLLRRYRDARPRVEVELIESSSSRLIELTRAHALDAAFVRPGDPLPAELRALELARERMVAVMADDHPLATRRRIALAQVLGEPLLLPPEGSGSSLSRWVGDAARELGLSLKVAARVAHAASLVHLSAAGVGVAIVPESLMTMRTRGVRYVRLSTGDRLALLLVTHGEPRVPALAALVDAALDAR